VLLTGSGTETVTTIRHITVAVDLGTPHASAQFSPGARSSSFVSRRVTFDGG
jgi:hypothetical protein